MRNERPIFKMMAGSHRDVLPYFHKKYGRG